MTFEVAIGDRLRKVSVVRKAGVLHVEVDGALHVVDARRVGDALLSLLVHPDGESASRSVDAAFAQRGGNGDLDVHIAGRTIPVQIRPAGAFGRQKKEGAAGSATGPQRIIAPMPGKVVRVLVQPGDQVKARQGLVVVEAMKMENELRAARDGHVREVSVREGQSVDAGAVLMVVE
jgi:biotin carboxyl carrier protein